MQLFNANKIQLRKLENNCKINIWQTSENNIFWNKHCAVELHQILAIERRVSQKKYFTLSLKWLIDKLYNHQNQ